jgi:hypothetical protein
MRFTDNLRTRWLSTDEAYERFFDGYYNLGRPDEIFGRNVVVSWPKAEVPKAAVGPRIARPGRSARRLAGVK